MNLFGLFDALVPEQVPLADGTTLAALVTQPPEGEQLGIVVLVHGFTGSKEDFVLVMPDLAERGWTCVAHDARGTYESSGGGAVTRQQLAADLLDVVRWARQRYGDVDVHVVGHSYGGLVAQEAVAMATGEITSLVLMCSGPSGVAVTGAELQAITIERARQFLGLVEEHDLPEAWDIKAAFEGLAMDNPFARFLQTRFLATDRESLRQAARDLLDTPDLVARVRSTHVPVRWCRGANDGSWAPSVQDDAAARYGTAVHLIPAPAAHSPALENDEDTTAWLDATLRRLQAR